MIRAARTDPAAPSAPLAGLCVAALGVVYGDIGTSPLYALRECFTGEHQTPVTEANVLGVLSLIFWTLILVVTLKYTVDVLRMDNRGEGGILALMSLLKRGRGRGIGHGDRLAGRHLGHLLADPPGRAARLPPPESGRRARLPDRDLTVPGAAVLTFFTVTS